VRIEMARLAYIVVKKGLSDMLHDYRQNNYY